MQELRCINCGGQLNYDKEDRTDNCPFCGSKFRRVGEDAESILERANQFLELGKPESAALQFRRILDEFDSLSPDAWWGMTVCGIKNGFELLKGRQDEFIVSDPLEEHDVWKELEATYEKACKYATDAQKTDFQKKFLALSEQLRTSEKQYMVQEEEERKACEALEQRQTLQSLQDALDQNEAVLSHSLNEMDRLRHRQSETQEILKRKTDFMKKLLLGMSVAAAAGALFWIATLLSKESNALSSARIVVLIVLLIAWMCAAYVIDAVRSGNALSRHVSRLIWGAEAAAPVRELREETGGLETELRQMEGYANESRASITQLRSEQARQAAALSKGQKPADTGNPAPEPEKTAQPEVVKENGALEERHEKAI